MERPRKICHEAWDGAWSLAWTTVPEPAWSAALPERLALPVRAFGRLRHRDARPPANAQTGTDQNAPIEYHCIINGSLKFP